MKKILKVLADAEALQAITDLAQPEHFIYKDEKLFLILTAEDANKVYKVKEVNHLNNMFVTEITESNYKNELPIIQQEFEKIQIENDIEKLEEEHQDYLQTLKQKLLSFEQLLKEQKLRGEGNK